MKEQILAVQRMQDYIETHLDEKIGLSELSQVSLFSPWYSYRIFQEYTGMTPAHYIRRFRLTRAALRLKKENTRADWFLRLALKKRSIENSLERDCIL